MMAENKQNAPLSDAELQDMVASADAGARSPAGSVGTFLAVLAIIWSVFQIVLASPISNMILPGSVINSSRQIHLGFAIFLAYMAYPAFKTSPRHYIPYLDWGLGILGTFCALYGWIYYAELVNRPGLPTSLDIFAAATGLILLFEAARRALGPAMAIVAVVFLCYVFFGAASWVPEVIRWKGASLNKAMSHMWITSEGVFGIALGVSTKFVFLFVLFGALLDKAGAGNYFIKMAFAALGHLRGGPAKAAVVGSAATGLISGSSIANVVTTGTFTIPLMKRVGFSSEQAGAVEVASSVNGQIMPPVMGAAAFLMVEYVGISYVEVITHAFLPATISYIALVYIVHLEAVKRNMPTLQKASGKAAGVLATALSMLGFFLGFAALCYATQYPVRWITSALPAGSGMILAILLAAIYIGLLYMAAQVPDLEPDDPNDPNIVLPEVTEIYKSGLYYLLPIIVLVYFLMIEQKSPGLSAFWATSLLIFILITQRPLKAIFRGESEMAERFKDGVADLLQGLIDGARNMIGIGLATAAAGVIVGTVTLTGIGQVMADLVEFVSGGNLILMLVFVGILSLILGMGLPTTANYIVVSSLMAGVVVELGAANGLIVPLIAVHLFVFYFGIMADVTPPVGLASFAAAAVSGGDAIKTGFIGFFYSLRTVALPFVFIFNTDLLLIDVTMMQGIVVFLVSTVAILVFTAGTMGFWMTKSKIYESLALILIAFMLFRPDFFLNYMAPEFETKPASEVFAMAENSDAGGSLRVRLIGESIDGNAVDSQFLLPLGDKSGDGVARLFDNAGIEFREEEGKILVDNLNFGGPAEQLGIDFDWELAELQVKADRMAKEVFFIPAFILLGLIYMLQMARKRREDGLVGEQA
nr:TRAP transporter permease [Amylibacter ulvae]